MIAGLEVFCDTFAGVEFPDFAGFAIFAGVLIVVWGEAVDELGALAFSERDTTR